MQTTYILEKQVFRNVIKIIKIKWADELGMLARSDVKNNTYSFSVWKNSL